MRSESIAEENSVTGAFYHYWREEIDGEIVHILRRHGNDRATAKGGALYVTNRAKELLENGTAFAVFAWRDESDSTNVPPRAVKNVYISPKYVRTNPRGDVRHARHLR